MEQLLAASPQAVPAHEREASGRLTILVVDDELLVLRLYEKRMARWSIRPVVITARSGTEALVKLGLTRPDLLVTDLHMPDVDGFQMLERLRTMSELTDMTTVVVSALDNEEIESRGGVPAGIPVLPKPVPFDRLRDIATVVADRKRRNGPNQGMTP